MQKQLKIFPGILIPLNNVRNILPGSLPVCFGIAGHALKFWLMILFIAGCTSPAEKNYLTGDSRFDLVHQFSRGRGYAVEVAMDGSVIAPVGGGILKLSTDGGSTWKEVDAGISGVPLVNEVSGEVLFVALPYRSESLLDNPVSQDNETGYYFPVHRSKDHGLTWEKYDAVIHKDGNGWLPSSGGAENGITLRYGEKAGRLLLPSRVFVDYERGSRNADHYNTAIYSDDGGLTWFTGAPFPEKGTGEGTLAELSDGRIYYNSRSHMAEDAKRREAWSYDGGETWNDLRVSFLPDRAGRTYFAYGCKGGLIRLPFDDEDVLIYSNLDIPLASTYRSHISVWASFDGGDTWPVKRLVYPGPSGYSMLAAGRKGTASEGLIYLMFEGYPDDEVRKWPDLDQYFARFTLDWVVEGTLTGDGYIPEHFKR